MAAPAAVARGVPGGTKLRDGFRTLVTLELFPTIEFWEKSVTPPGIDGGDEIEQTTMHSIRWRTFAPRQLCTLKEMTLTAAYDPVVFVSLVQYVNVAMVITVIFPDGATWAFYGFIKEATPSENKEGDQPELNITIRPTNEDPVAYTEQDPVVTTG